jgi:hypothetical protein
VYIIECVPTHTYLWGGKAMRTRDDYLKALTYGYIRIKKDKHVIRYNKVDYSLARAVWWLHHPEEDLAANEEIHHMDWNNLNDEPENLIKVPTLEHRRIHKHAIDLTYIKKFNVSLDLAEKTLKKGHEVINKSEEILKNI